MTNYFIKYSKNKLLIEIGDEPVNYSQQWKEFNEKIIEERKKDRLSPIQSLIIKMIFSTLNIVCV